MTISFIPNRDAEGNHIYRQMFAGADLYYRPRTIDFVTGKHNSLCNKNSEGVDLGDAEVLFFSAARAPMVKGAEENDEAFQARLDAGCKYTWLYFTPETRYGVRGAQVAKKGVASGELDVWFERAPHIPKAYGGSVAAMEGGLALDMFPDGQLMTIDADACAIVEIDEEYYSHRMGLKIEHEIGDKITILGVFLIYA